jgi:hypothetical protein
MTETYGPLDRLVDIVNESCGLQPVQSPEETLTALEHHLFEQRALIWELTKERDKLRAALLVYVEVYGNGADHHPDECPDPATCLEHLADAQAEEALRR